MATTSNSSPRRSRDISNFARKYLLFLIPIMTVVVIGTVACIFIFNPEQQVKSKLSSLAQHYYEDYFYTNLENSDQFSGDAEKALQKYEDKGLPPVTLRQLILANKASDSSDATFLSKHCDNGATSVKFYPEVPYTRTSYHVEYAYSCNFQ
ncbi:hypothetical protein IKF21_01010 [Candidatus Saccharibacteria bacterium]|nr:hypothetical protein [Candidatus Saccharibacteria bacterium]